MPWYDVIERHEVFLLNIGSLLIQFNIAKENSTQVFCGLFIII